MDFASEFVTDLIHRKILPNSDERVEVLWKSADGIDFTRIETDADPEAETELNRINLPQPGTSNSVAKDISGVPKNVKGLQADLKKTLKPDVKNKKGKKSSVWHCFVKTPSGGTCKLCGVAVRSSGNTTNLANHLSRRHSDSGRNVSLLPQIMRTSSFGGRSKAQDDNPDDPDELSGVTENNETTPMSMVDCRRELPNSVESLKDRRASVGVQPRIDNAVSKMVSFKDGGTKAAALTNARLYMIVKDDLPLNTSEKEGFRHFMSVAAPLFKTPGRSKVTATLDAKYEVLSELVKKKLLRVSGFTLTADVWTETMSFTSFLGCTIHFVDDGKLIAIVLNVAELNERHASPYLSQIFLSICSHWGIPLNKITAVVTDNGANIVKAVSDTFGAHRHLPCFAHSLNLVVTKVIEACDPVKSLISQVKTIVTYFKQSTTASDELRKSQNNDAPLRLIQDVATRWNSTFYMLERFLELIDTVSSVLLKLPKSPPMLTASEVAIARELI